MEKILVFGAAGQLGSELTRALVDQYGSEQVIATDLNHTAKTSFDFCRFEQLDIMDHEAVRKLVRGERITQIYHLVAILSAMGEQKPALAWKLNMESLLFILELARECKLNRVYWPSSIAVFGSHTPKVNTPQYCVKDPKTVYGISKLAGENWCEYYFEKYQVDIRSIRYPGLIGYKALPGGGTTDYAVEIYHKALKREKFACFLKETTKLPMLYMPDAIKATLDLMAAPKESIRIRSSYNVQGMSFSPAELYNSILLHLPDFEIMYAPDFRQQIAEAWPQSINDQYAREDWNWKPKYDLPMMTQSILENLPKYFSF